MLKRALCCFIVSVFLFNSTYLTAQTQAEVSAMLTALERHPEEDSVKVELLLDLVRAYRRNDPQKAKDYANTAIQLSERLQNDFCLGSASMYQASVSYLTGDLQTAQTQCLKAISFFEKGNKYPNEQADCTMFSGSIALSNGDPAAALRYYESALLTFEKVQNVKKQISTIVGIANCYKRLGNNEKALELYLKGLKRSEANNYKDNLILLYSNISFIYEDMGKYSLGLDYRLKTIDLLKESNDLNGLAKEYNNMSGTYFRLNDKIEAGKYLEKALELHRKLNDKFGETLAAINISITYDDDQKAVAALENALTYSRGTNNKYLLGLALKNLSFKYINLKQYTTAYGYLKEAFEVEKDGKNQENITILNLNSAEVLVQCSDEDLRTIGIDPKNRYDKAKEFLDIIFLPSSNANVRQIAQAWQILSTIHEKQNNYTRAYESFKNYISLKDSVASDDIRKQITRKEIQYEFDKKESELKYQQQITIEQLERQQLLNFQQEQTLLLNRQSLTLKEQALALSNREKDMAHLAYLNEQAEKEENAQKLSLSQEREKGKERDLLLKNLELSAQQKQNLYLLAFALLLLSGLGALLYFYNTLKKQKNIIAQQNELNEHTINILSHDIRGPLMVVNLMLKKLNKDDPFVAEASQSLQAQILAVNSILNNLLKMKKLSLTEKGKNLSANVNAVLKNVLLELNTSIRDKALSIQNDVKDDTSLPIASEKLQIILNNLLSNAIKYSYQQQTIRIYEEGRGICIQDSGVGLTPEERSKLMREVSASKLGTKQERGSGLGLYLVGAMLQGESLNIIFDSPQTGGTIVKLSSLLR